MGLATAATLLTALTSWQRRRRPPFAPAPCPPAKPYLSSCGFSIGAASVALGGGAVRLGQILGWLAFGQSVCLLQDISRAVAAGRVCRHPCGRAPQISSERTCSCRAMTSASQCPVASSRGVHPSASSRREGVDAGHTAPWRPRSILSAALPEPWQPPYVRGVANRAAVGMAAAQWHAQAQACTALLRGQHTARSSAEASSAAEQEQASRGSGGRVSTGTVNMGRPALRSEAAAETTSDVAAGCSATADGNAAELEAGLQASLRAAGHRGDERASPSEEAEAAPRRSRGSRTGPQRRNLPNLSNEGLDTAQDKEVATPHEKEVAKPQELGLDAEALDPVLTRALSLHCTYCSCAAV